VVTGALRFVIIPGKDDRIAAAPMAGKTKPTQHCYTPETVCH
jgi:hypothetical protein